MLLKILNNNPHSYFLGKKRLVFEVAEVKVKYLFIFPQSLTLPQ